ncbi:MAG: DUF4388 domain-containing protein [Polyangiaceae bacterium]|nr:DUF4388 domain-containing protein [Polyangiaceae bacterium]
MEQRSERIATTFWMTVEGIDAVPVLREGDVSVSGIRFETDVRLGNVGDVHPLTILSSDGVHGLRVFAKVVRSVVADHGRRALVAFAFLPASSVEVAACQDFADHALGAGRHHRSGIRPRIAPELATALRREPSRRDVDLVGHLSRISLPTICAVLDMDRLSGALVVERGGETATLRFRDGRIFDIDPMGNAESLRARLAMLFAWTEGSFEFTAHPIDSLDGIAPRTSRLLLDVAGAADESDWEARSEGF